MNSAVMFECGRECGVIQGTTARIGQSPYRGTANDKGKRSLVADQVDR